VTDNIVNALLEGLFACLVFLDESPDDIVDPDSAVRTMENAAAPLLTLSADDRATLVGLIRDHAATIPDATWRDFVSRQPFALGLIDDPQT
jgi:hypothetical protein